jgi:hypothetical protein
MLRNLHDETEFPEIRIKDAAGNPLFHEGVEYSSPARGTWTVAHVSMLIPRSHQIYVGGDGCLRGVVLSAAEFGGLDRFSMITVKEDDIYQNKMEDLFIDGITDILNNLPSLPPAVVVFTSCIHEFMACDMDLVYAQLKKRFPGVDFIPTHMNPTMRRSGISPEELMRQQMYAALDMRAKNPKSVNIVGNCYARNTQSELLTWLHDSGYTVLDICSCSTYEEYKVMAESSVNIYTIPLMEKGARVLEQRLHQEAVYLPVSFSYENIRKELMLLAEKFHLKHMISSENGVFCFDALEQQSDRALAHAKEIIGGMPVVIDYAAVTRPLELARLLVEHGFNVVRVYTDTILPGDEDAFAWLKENAPELPLHSVVNFRCRFVPRDGTIGGVPVLAVGQKAAYFAGTNHFVNIVENGDLWGFDGICRLARMMEDAAQHEKDMRSMIQIKAWGCRG